MIELATRRPEIKRSNFMAIAQAIALNSTCHDRQVGCIAVDKREHILATGYNGFPRGLLNCNETYTACPKDAEFPCLAVHAEANMLVQCREPFKIHAIYCTREPCLACTLLLLNTSCQFVYYKEDRDKKHSEARKLWLDYKRGTTWIKI